ncbi:hypothetical protein [Microcystis aeruginosa]|uniref:Uncharacterized protein n=1 Tax=Microcystis aeruginosa FD4 TaxID=2686288 RepID=A0A857CZB2_MICAE|nr:hypothetical protein [Microcystis aeruginosa]QGZ88712.1 hypothetical protein GQR42_02860 [Microcystis aeruginosa FD4]
MLIFSSKTIELLQKSHIYHWVRSQYSPSQEIIFIYPSHPPHPHSRQFFFSAALTMVDNNKRQIDRLRP